MTIQENRNAEFIALDTATPAAQGLRITDSAGNGYRWYQYAASTTWVDLLGGNTGIMISGAITMRANLQAVADGGYDIGASGSRFRDAYLRRTLIKEQTAWTGSQAITVTGAVQTTDATTTTLFTSPTLLDNSGTSIEVRVTARDTGGTDRGAAVRRALVTRQAGGGATLVGTVQDDWTNVPAGWGGGVALTQCTIDTTGNTFRVRVQGAAATTINWTCEIRYQTVSGNT